MSQKPVLQLPWSPVRPVIKIHLSGQPADPIKAWLDAKKIHYFMDLGGVIVTEPLIVAHNHESLLHNEELLKLATEKGFNVEPLLLSVERGGMADDGRSGAACVVFGPRGKVRSARRFSREGDSHAVFVSPAVTLAELIWADDYVSARISLFTVRRWPESYEAVKLTKFKFHGPLAELEYPDERQYALALRAAKEKSEAPHCTSVFYAL